VSVWQCSQHSAIVCINVVIGVEDFSALCLHATGIIKHWSGGCLGSQCPITANPGVLMTLTMVLNVATGSLGGVAASGFWFILCGLWCLSRLLCLSVCLLILPADYATHTHCLRRRLRFVRQVLV